MTGDEAMRARAFTPHPLTFDCTGRTRFCEHDLAAFARSEVARALEEAVHWFETSTFPTEHMDAIKTCIAVLRARAAAVRGEG
jgi:hypothetical protein